MDPQKTPTDQTDDEPKTPASTETSGVPTVDPATGSVSNQPIGTDPIVSSKSETPVVPDVAGSAVQPTVTGADSDSSSPVITPMSGGMVSPAAPVGGGKKRWLMPAVLAAVALVVVGGAYVFAFYLPNQPSAVYSKSLENSGKALDVLVNYSDVIQHKDYKSYNMDGTLTVKTSGPSFDAKMSGAFDNKLNGTMTLDADILGQKMNMDLRVKRPEIGTTPDLYLRVNGIKSMLDTYGLSSLDSLDGQWVSVDHTMLDSAAARYGDVVAQTASTSTFPTSDQMHDAFSKVQAVNKKYLFTTDSDTAVLKNQEYVGKETKDGRSVYHYKVGYDKAHLQAYVSAIGTALDGSSLNTWSKQANDGKKLSEVMDIDSLHDSVKDAKADYTFDAFVDTKTKLLQTIKFTDPKDASSVFTVSQNYTGGDSYPLELAVTGNESGEKTTADFKMTANVKTDKIDAEMTAAQGTTSMKMVFSMTPSANAVKVDTPTGVMTVTELLNKFGLGNLSSGL
jgi:hypothetical protein